MSHYEQGGELCRNKRIYAGLGDTYRCTDIGDNAVAYLKVLDVLPYFNDISNGLMTGDKLFGYAYSQVFRSRLSLRVEKCMVGD